MSRRYRIRCGAAMHVVEMADDGSLAFHAHPAAFADVDRERAMAVLSGEPPSEGEGCLRLAWLVRTGALSFALAGGDDGRKLLAALRGVRIARRLHRAGTEQHR